MCVFLCKIDALQLTVPGGTNAHVPVRRSLVSLLLVHLSSLASVLPPAGRQCLQQRRHGVGLCLCAFSGPFQCRPQLNPSPAPLGLCVHRIGSVMPLPSGPRPIPGHQPMFCSIRFPRFESGMGGTPSPTMPTRREVFKHERSSLNIQKWTTRKQETRFLPALHIYSRLCMLFSVPFTVFFREHIRLYNPMTENRTKHCVCV